MGDQEDHDIKIFSDTLYWVLKIAIDNALPRRRGLEKNLP